MTREGWLWVTASEVLLLLSFGTAGLLALRRRHRSRDAVQQITGTFEDTLATLVPRRLARLLLFEVHGWHALFKLGARRSRSAAPTIEFPYATGLGTLMAVVLGLTVVEVPVFAVLAALLLPWLAAKVVLTVVELYAIWFVLSLWAGLVTSPHVIRDQRLVLRAGLLAGMVIPLEDLAAMRLHRQSWSAQLGPLFKDGVAAFPINGSTELELRLCRPAVVWRLLGRDVSVEDVHLHADDPSRMLEALSRHLESRVAGPEAARQDGPLVTP
jgi:hypothetical protein